MTSISTSQTDSAGPDGEGSDALARSHAFCEATTKREAKNFYYGMKLTPGDKRRAMYAVYAWMRLADDLADEAGEASEKTARIERFWKLTQRAIDPEVSSSDAMAAVDGTELGPVASDGLGCWPAMRETAIRYEIPSEYLEAMVRGQLLDQEATRYETFDELYQYCYKVASVVGLTCITIWGYEGGEETRQLAEWRGIAFQLTNILRDVREDALRNRIYLPAEDFDYPPTPERLLARADPGLTTAIEETVWRAGDFYKKSEPLDERVHGDGRACLWAMTKIYRGLLGKIEVDPAAVLKPGRIRLSTLSKCLIAWRAKWMAR